MPPRPIEIRGARTHHLKDLSLDLPREAWTVVCGVSGSGKSSLVLDTLGAESYRRFLGTLERGAAPRALARPDVDRIDGLPPAVTAGFLVPRARAPARRSRRSPRSTTALRVLFARAAVPHCPRCGARRRAVSPERVIERLLARPRARASCSSRRAGRGPEAARRGAARRLRARPRRAGGSCGSTTARADGRGRTTPSRSSSTGSSCAPDARTRFADSVEQGFRAGGGVAARRSSSRPPGRGRGRRDAEEDLRRPPVLRAAAASPIRRSRPRSSRSTAPRAPAPTCEGLGTTSAASTPSGCCPRDARLRRALARVVPAIAAGGPPAAAARVRPRAQGGGARRRATACRRSPRRCARACSATTRRARARCARSPRRGPLRERFAADDALPRVPRRAASRPFPAAARPRGAHAARPARRSRSRRCGRRSRAVALAGRRGRARPAGARRRRRAPARSSTRSGSATSRPAARPPTALGRASCAARGSPPRARRA